MTTIFYGLNEVNPHKGPRVAFTFNRDNYHSVEQALINKALKIKKTLYINPELSRALLNIGEKNLLLEGLIVERTSPRDKF